MPGWWPRVTSWPLRAGTCSPLAKLPGTAVSAASPPVAVGCLYARSLARLRCLCGNSALCRFLKSVAVTNFNAIKQFYFSFPGVQITEPKPHFSTWLFKLCNPVFI